MGLYPIAKEYTLCGDGDDFFGSLTLAEKYEIIYNTIEEEAVDPQLAVNIVRRLVKDDPQLQKADPYSHGVTLISRIIVLHHCLESQIALMLVRENLIDVLTCIEPKDYESYPFAEPLGDIIIDTCNDNKYYQLMDAAIEQLVKNNQWTKSINLIMETLSSPLIHKANINTFIKHINITFANIMTNNVTFTNSYITILPRDIINYIVPFVYLMNI